ncbi:hypothetical protein WR25_22099 [Diploscapter pachys]|uniref:Uncharacterized protein n=1 Tax=Diploscapter pachys TaxID=2018661 RepID=A0A2A2K7K5_9BILA|nr:hypothetical protein WR25_22099 [Diploscapter pachys]
MSISIQAILVDSARYLGTEFLQQAVAGRQGLVYPTPLGDIDADCQVTHPQPLLIQHRRHQHVGQQMAAVLAHQCPVRWLCATFLRSLGKHRLAGADLATKTLTQGMGALVQLISQYQVLQTQLAQGFTGRIAQHAFGTRIESADHPAQAGGDNRNLSRSIKHAAQLIVSLAQRLLADT